MKNIKWFVNRLESMSASEVVWRVQQKALKISEYKKYFTAQMSVIEIELSQKLESLKPQIERLGINWENQNYQLFESLDIFGVFDYQEYKRQWNAGFQTENVWPTTDFSYDIATSQREDVGDIRTNWELNRHFQFVGLAKNYCLTGEIQYLNELKDLFDNWNENNLFLHGVQWTSAMEIAIRVVSWSYMYAFVEKAFQKNENNRDQKFLDETSHGIKVMVDHILKHRARYSSANNHLIVEMLAIGVAGILFDYNKWSDTAIKILTEELPKQNTIDGVNKEMSLHYQSFVMEAYGILWMLMRSNNISVPDSWKTYLTRMSEFVADCCGDYGEVVVYGDNDEGKILDFYGKIEDHYRYVLQLMGSLLVHRYTNTELIENICWLCDEKIIRKYWEKNMYEPSLVQFYKEGGYTILRSKDHKVLIGFDHADLGFGRIAAHGHADALSIQVFYEGKPVLIDPGTYNYHIPKKTRNEIRKTAAHNTVYIEGKEQAEILGPFLWGKRYKIHSVECENNDAKVKIKASIEYEGSKQNRSLEFDFHRNLVVSDIVETKRTSYQLWHFAPRIIVIQDNCEPSRINVKIQSTSSNMSTEKFDYSNRYGQKEIGVQYFYKIQKNKIKTELNIS